MSVSEISNVTPDMIDLEMSTKISASYVNEAFRKTIVSSRYTFLFGTVYLLTSILDIISIIFHQTPISIITILTKIFGLSVVCFSLYAFIVSFQIRNIWMHIGAYTYKFTRSYKQKEDNLRIKQEKVNERYEHITELADRLCILMESNNTIGLLPDSI